MTSKKVIENEIIDCSDVIYIEDDSDGECCLNENTYCVPGEDDLFGYDSDCDNEIPLDDDDDKADYTVESNYDSDDDNNQTGYKLGLKYYKQNKIQ